MNGKADEHAAIIGRMQELRSTGQMDVSELHAQAIRVADWREHVRSQPLLSMIAASIVGYSVVRLFSSAESRGVPVVQAPLVSSAPRKSVATGLASVAGGMATSIARQWLTEYVKKQLGVNTHVADQSTPSDRSTSVEKRSNTHS